MPNGTAQPYPPHVINGPKSLGQVTQNVLRSGRPRGPAKTWMTSQLGLARGRTWHQLRLLLIPVQGGKGAHPRQRRAEPVLPAWDEITALATLPANSSRTPIAASRVAL